MLFTNIKDWDIQTPCEPIPKGMKKLWEHILEVDAKMDDNEFISKISKGYGNYYATEWKPGGA